MPQPGGPDSEPRRTDELHVDLSLPISRRRLLQIVKYGGIAAAGAVALGGIQRIFPSGETRPVTPTPQLPQPLSPAERAVLPQRMIEEIEKERAIPTPTPEKQRGVLFVKEVMIPERWSRDTMKAAVASEDFVFYTGRDGRLAAFSLSGRKEVWQSEERGIPLASETGTVYLLRDDNRLLALDSKTGKTRWYSITGLATRVSLRPSGLVIEENVVYLTFSGQQNPLTFVIDKSGTSAGKVIWNGEGEVVARKDSLLILKKAAWGFTSVDAKTGGIGEAPTRIGILWSAAFEDQIFGFGGGKLVAATIAPYRVLWQTDESIPEQKFDPQPGIIPKRQNVYIYEGFKRQIIALGRETGKYWQSFPFLILPFGGGDFLEEIDKWLLMSYTQSGFTQALGLEGKNVFWTNKDLRFNRIAGTSNEIVVAVYNDPQGQRDPEVTAFELNTGQRKWYPIPISNPSHKVIIHKDKAVFGTGSNVRVLDVNSGKDAISLIKLPARPAQIMSHEDFILVASGTPGKVGSLQVIRI